MDANLKLEQVMEMLNRDEKFAKILFAEETPEGAQTVLRQAGIDFTVEEIKLIARRLSHAQENNGRELDEEELASVAGGNPRKKDPIYAYGEKRWAELVAFFSAW